MCVRSRLQTDLPAALLLTMPTLNDGRCTRTGSGVTLVLMPGRRERHRERGRERNEGWGSLGRLRGSGCLCAQGRKKQTLNKNREAWAPPFRGLLLCLRLLQQSQDQADPLLGCRGCLACRCRFHQAGRHPPLLLFLCLVLVLYYTYKVF